MAIALEASGPGPLRAEAAPSDLRKELRALRGVLGKVLVRWRPDDSKSLERRQLDTLHELDELVRGAGSRLLLELLIPPGPHNAGGTASGRDWEEAVLPRLQYGAAEEILGSGIAPTRWKIEGHPNAEAAGALAALVGSARTEASILVLGGGSEIADLRQVFSCGVGSERFSGFAVGRSIWQKPVAALCRGETTEAEHRLDAIGVVTLTGAVLELLELDSYGTPPVALMAPEPGDEIDAAFRTRLIDTVSPWSPTGSEVRLLDRQDFYREAADAEVIMATGETAVYANVILRKGVTRTWVAPD